MASRLRISFVLLAGLAFVLVACGGGSKPASEPTELPTVSAASPATPADDNMFVGRPLNRVGVGDVGRAFARYEDSRADLIALFKAQDWYNDGLTRDESLFVERSLSFVARYPGPYTDSLQKASVERKLYEYRKVKLSQGEIEVLLVYEPGQDSKKEMDFIEGALPVAESLAQVQFPEKMLYIINGEFPINDFNDGQFIRIARCCVTSPFVLAHELSHAYWTIGPSWYNEGMADIYSELIQQYLQSDPPPGWKISVQDLDQFYAGRKQVAGRFPPAILPRRNINTGLYENADIFLLDLRRILGHDEFMAATSAIYQASDFSRYNLREKKIEDIFLQHTDTADQAQVMALFNLQIWGDNGEQYQKLKELDNP